MKVIFKKLIGTIILSSLAVSVSVSPAQAVEYSKPSSSLVSTSWLKDNLSNPKLVLLAVSNEDGTYERGHIEGARKIIWKSELANLGATSNKNGIISKSAFTTVAQKLGVSADSVVVLYGEKSQLQSSWGFWVFKLYGAKNIYLLDGGLPEWIADSGATTLTVPAKVKAGNFKATNQNIALRAQITEVIAAVNSTSARKPVIVDNRAVEGYLGQSASTGLGNAAANGHIASSKNVPTSSLQNADGTYKSRSEIRAAFAAAGVDGKRPTILYCGTGLLASAAWFSLTQILGYENVKNYDGSWFEYAAVADAPKELKE